MAELTQKEIDERVAILKRFKILLQQQRAKFREYLTVLEKQQSSITSDNPDALLAHTELEQQVVSNIVNLQKVIVPMHDLYKQINKNGFSSESDQTVDELQKDLSDLQTKVLAQNEKNRSLLQTHISQIRVQLNSLRNPYANTRSVYAQKAPVASLVEIEA